MTTPGKRTASQRPSSESCASELHQKTAKNGMKVPLTSKGFQRHFAKHEYHDYSQLKPSQFSHLDVKPVRGGVHCPFPILLHRMMEDAKAKDFEGIVSWQPHGRSFLIHKPRDFVKSILPKYFKHSKMASFQRQLSLYGFKRLTQEGPDRGAYYHEAFLRGREFICSNIRRTRIKGTWIRTSSSPSEEPNFYAMDPVCDVEDIDGTATTTSLSSRQSSIDRGSSEQSSTSAGAARSPSFPPPEGGQDHQINHVVPSHVSYTCQPKTLEYGNLKHSLLNTGVDNELASFLTDVDLDADLDSDFLFTDVMQFGTI
eukprot:scaffold2044_cov206-Cylindrotheca_fusiformis.AAC.6